LNRLRKQRLGLFVSTEEHQNIPEPAQHSEVGLFMQRFKTPQGDSILLFGSLQSVADTSSLGSLYGKRLCQIRSSGSIIMKCNFEDPIRGVAIQIIGGTAMSLGALWCRQGLKNGVANLIMHKGAHAPGRSLPDQMIPAGF